MRPRELLLTGVTGFLGKVLLEEVLRRREQLGLDRVHVLIRARGDRDPARRFRSEVQSASCFRELPPGWERWVSVVPGDLVEPGCGLESASRDELTARVTHVIHAAASVEFDLPLGAATASNVTSSLNVRELARTCPQLESIVCLSTAYVTPQPGDGAPVPEQLAPLPRPAAEIYHGIIEGSEREDALLAETGHPNTYTLTKSLAEHLLVEHGGPPLAIVRPSIVSASWRRPFPGWIDSKAAFAGFVALLGTGRLRAVVADPEAELDVVPCDEVATRVVDCAFARDAAEGGPAIVHAVAGAGNRCRVDVCQSVIEDFFTRHPVEGGPAIRYVGPRGPRFRWHAWVQHRLPSVNARGAASSLIERLDYINRVFPYFTQHTFDFESSAPLDDPDFDAREYVETVCRGVHAHLLRRDPAETGFAGARHTVRGGDLRWALRRPRGTPALRAAAYAATKALRRCTDRITFDLPSFEAARAAVRDDEHLVIVPTHRSYMDFVLCSYLFFARPDLDIGIPYIAAAEEFSRVPIVGRILPRLRAFWVKRGYGRENAELTRRVQALVGAGHALEFFIEGTRSRSRQFLPPRRGLLRCIHRTGEPCAILPVAITYDRVPEELAFLEELGGEPARWMRLGPLVDWLVELARGRVDLGRVHIACGEPQHVDAASDLAELTRGIMGQLQATTATTSFHLRAFLRRYPVDGVDLAWVREAIRRRGGRVLDSRLRASELDAKAAPCLRYQFLHLFYPEARAAFGDNAAIDHHLRANAYAPAPDRDPWTELGDPQLRAFLEALFKPICRDYSLAAEALGSPSEPLKCTVPRDVVLRAPAVHLPNVEAAFEALTGRGILRRGGDRGYAWGPHARDVSAYLEECRWPGFAGPTS